MREVARSLARSHQGLVVDSMIEFLKDMWEWLICDHPRLGAALHPVTGNRCLQCPDCLRIFEVKNAAR